MAQLTNVSVIFLLLFCGSAISDNCKQLEDKGAIFNKLTEVVLDYLNKNSDYGIRYDSAKIISGYHQNGSQVVLLAVSSGCDVSSYCSAAELVCEAVLDDQIQVLETRCEVKQEEPVVPPSHRGFTEHEVDEELRKIAEFAIQQLSTEQNVKRNMLQIMSVREQAVDNETSLFLTVQVTAADKGDLSELEVCEVGVNRTGDSALESTAACFPLSGHPLPTQTPLLEDVGATASLAASRLAALTSSPFTFTLVEVIEAIMRVTPGSEGVLTSLRMLVSPTMCPTQSRTALECPCAARSDVAPLACKVSAWERPWMGDTLYSNPSCEQVKDFDEPMEEEPAEPLVEVQDKRLEEKPAEPLVEVQDKRLVEEPAEPLVEVQDKRLVEEPAEPLVEVQDKRLEEKPAEPLVEVQDKRLVEEPAEPLVEVQDKRLVEEPAEPLVEVQDKRLVEEPAEPLVEVQDKRLVEKPAEPLVEVQDKRLVEEPTEPLVEVQDKRLVEELAESTLDPFEPTLDTMEPTSDAMEPEDHSVDTWDISGILADIDSIWYETSSSPEASADPIGNGTVPSSSQQASVEPLEEEIMPPTPLGVSVEPLEDGIVPPTPPEARVGPMEDDMVPPTTLPGDIADLTELEEDRTVSPTPLEAIVDSIEDKVVLEEAVALQPVVEEAVVSVVNTACTGCLADLNVDNPQLAPLVEEALQHLDQSSEGESLHRLVNIIRAQRQVVNGVRYVLSLEVGETACAKGSGAERGECPPSPDRATRTCVVEFLQAPGQHREVSANSCSQRDGNQLSNDILHYHADYPEEMPLQAVHRDESQDYLESFGGETQKPEKVPTKTSEVRKNKWKDAVAKLRVRREVLGKPSPVGALKDIKESERELVDQLAQDAVRTLDDLDADDMKRVVLEVLEARKQLVNGVMYHLTIKVGLTSCKEDGSSKPTCMEKSAPFKVCKVQLHRSFAEESGPVARVVQSECSSDTRPNRSRRTTMGVPGGLSEANTTATYIQEAANFALPSLGGDSNYHQHLVRVVSAMEQVVAGRNIFMVLEISDTDCLKSEEKKSTCQPQPSSSPVTCDVTVYERLWENYREVKNANCSTIASTEESILRRRKSTRRFVRSSSGRLVGAPTTTEPDDPYIQELANAAISELDKSSNALYALKKVRVLSATKQVVSGTLVKLSMEVGYSSCRKHKDVNVDSCNFNENSNNQICHLDIWDRPWLKDRQYSNIHCSPVSDTPSSSNSASSDSITRTKRKVTMSHDIHIGMFREYMQRHGRSYKSEVEFKRRFRIFRANMMKVAYLQKTEQGTAKYGATRFADLTVKEFKKFHLGLNPNLRTKGAEPLQQAKIPDIKLPLEFDWRHYNVVTEVKNQGACGSCWAFSVTGNVEGQWALKSGKLLSLSEQELVDCDTLDSGCEGGLPDNAYRSLKKLGGLEMERDYPYEGEDETCHFNGSEVQVRVTGGLNITSNETQMAQWLISNGPISIGINANAMQFYMGGVSHPFKVLCNPANLDHGVLIVGYGVHMYPLFHKTLPYWTIKNSWGDRWGEQGYYRVYRGDGTCGVNQMATSAIVADAPPA